MRRIRKGYWPIATISFLLVTSCNKLDSESLTYTLYRNSPLDSSLRVHWATFDVADPQADFNRNQCEMAARLLNANVAASAEAEGKMPYPDVGFWCEMGTYSEDGPVPPNFDAEFPTDVRSGLHF